MFCKIQNLIDQLRSCWLSCTVDSGHAERGSVCSICLGSVKINWLCWVGATSARNLDQRGTCLTALLPGETVGNTAPIPGQANVTDTLGHLGVPGSRVPVQPPKVQTSAFTCVA